MLYPPVLNFGVVGFGAQEEAQPALGAGAWMARNHPAQTDTAVPDDSGHMQIVSGARERMDMMGASGDVVLGMHNGRHG